MPSNVEQLVNVVTSTVAPDSWQANGGFGTITYVCNPDEEIGSPITRPMIEDLGRRSAYALVTEPARDGGQTLYLGVRERRAHVADEWRSHRLRVRHRQQTHQIRKPLHGHDRLKGFVRGRKSIISAWCRRQIQKFLTGIQRKTACWC